MAKLKEVESKAQDFTLSEKKLKESLEGSLHSNKKLEE